ncbi:acyltransferase [Lysinibacillus macroides]|uniref:Acyltransferase n=1 Tax=Lysinibacillus macroides TaxID=33935 RepID=A0A0M9DHK9_9BACI|nr:acyltransferase [Lysinibacillus macroides]KOY80520.1 acyltransferase [Lysinibacillus macroides]QPR69654.1 acyltransferase [Lysinibacillus macroides]
MKRAHVYELDITRALAILAVLLIHATSTPVTALPSDSKLYPLYVALNIFPKFAVPVFIFLSGFVLFYNYIQKDLTKELIVRFYQKRVTQIVIPYLFFSIFYYAATRLFLTHDLALTWQALFSMEFLEKLLIGKAYTHLYYIFIMVQFYVMFPLMLYIIKKKPVVSPHLIWIGFVLQWAFILLNAAFWQYPYRGSIAFSYLFYFLAGGFLGIYFEKYKKWLQLKRENFSIAILLIWLLWLFATCYNIYLYYFVFSSQTYLASSIVFELAFELQAITASIVLLQLSFWIYHQWHRAIVNSLINLGTLSFGIYLLHPFFLFLYRQIPISGNSLVFHVWSVGGFVIALFVTWWVVLVIGKYINYHWIAFGPIPKTFPYKKS